MCHLLAGQVTCDLGALAPGTPVQVVIQARASAAAAPGGVTNQVSVSAANAPTVQAQATTTLYQESDLSVQKTGTPGVAYAGDLVRYTLTAANAGPSVAAGVLLTDTLPAALEYQTDTGGCTETGGTLVCALGSLAVGATRTLEVYARVRPEALPDTTAINTAVIASPASDPDLSNNTATAATLIQGLADLRVVQYTQPGGSVQAGEHFTYTIIVDNLGPGYAHAVELNGTLTSGGDFELLAVTSERPATCVPAPDLFQGHMALRCELTHPLEAVGNGTGRWTIQVLLQATESQTLNNVVEVSGADYDPNLSNNLSLAQLVISEVADLRIAKSLLGQVQIDGQPGGVTTLLPNRATAGAIMTYTITITNAGPSTARNVVVQDRLPAWLTVQATVPSQGLCNTAIPGNPAAPLICTLGTLGPEQDATVIIVAQVDAKTPDGTLLDNNALVYSDGYDSNNMDNYVTHFTMIDAWADLSVHKTAEPTTALPGQTLTYTIVVQNRGPSDAVGAQVLDLLPVGITDATWTCAATGGATYAPYGIGNLVETVQVPVGGMLVYTLRGTLNTAALITNTVTVAAPPAAGDPYPLDNSDSVVNRPLAIYLPLVIRFEQIATAPDLVIEELIVGKHSVHVVIANQGDAPVTQGFWVDLYIGPRVAPRAVNQIWVDLADQGMTWGINMSALPLEPGDTLVLSVSDLYYWASLSRVTWPLVEGTAVYAQVDSYSVDTNHGLVLEDHEIRGDPYNNVSGPVYVP